MSKDNNKTKDRPLNIRQEKFLSYLLQGLPATRAYEKAGYKARGNVAEVNASQLLRKPIIQKALEKRRREIARRSEISVARILEEEKRLAYVDPARIVDENGDLLPINKLPEDVRRAISSVEVRRLKDGTIKWYYRFWSKGKSLERIEKHLGMFERDNRQKRPKIFINAEDMEKPPDAGIG